MRVAAGRHVAAGDVAGDELLPGGEAGNELDGEILDAVALGLGEAADLACGELDVALDAVRHLAGAALDLFRTDHDVARPFVELQRVVLHRLLAAFFDRGQHFGHDLLGVARLGLRRLRRLFQMIDRHLVRLRPSGAAKRPEKRSGMSVQRVAAV